METYVCPVCGYGGLTQPPRSWTICPCCHTEFENSDADRTHDELRADWLAEGAPWASPVIPAPPGWDARRQLDEYLDEYLEAAGLSV